MCCDSSCDVLFEKSQHRFHTRQSYAVFANGNANWLFIQKNITISGAEAGYQVEIGSASSMVVATMATIMGGSVSVVCNVAEIAMEYHL